MNQFKRIGSPSLFILPIINIFCTLMLYNVISNQIKLAFNIFYYISCYMRVLRNSLTVLERICAIKAPYYTGMFAILEPCWNESVL